MVSVEEIFKPGLAKRLRAGGIHTAEELTQKTAWDVGAKIAGVGRKSVGIIRTELNRRGLHLKPDADPERDAFWPAAEPA